MGEVGVGDLGATQGSHCGLDGFGVVDVGTGAGAHDVVDTEPVGSPDDGAEVAGVLDVVEREDEGMVVGGGERGFALSEYGYYFGACLQRGDFGEFIVGCLDDLGGWGEGLEVGEALWCGGEEKA